MSDRARMSRSYEEHDSQGIANQLEILEYAVVRRPKPLYARHWTANENHRGAARHPKTKYRSTTIWLGQVEIGSMLCESKMTLV